MKTAKGILAALAIGGALAHAEPAVVEAVQYPAWLERGGNAVPLTPGTTLLPQDRLRTGSDARVQLRLGEGSTVKLGENARFVIEKVDDRGIFRAALAVLDGAFRFTTEALRQRRQREISIKVKNVTAGIRGTDLWGKSTGERDLVCLLEGKISVGSEGHPTVNLDTPLDFYQKPRDGEPQVAKVTVKQLEEWAQETEMTGAAASTGGTWRVQAASMAGRDDARALIRTLRAGGYPAVVVAAPEGSFKVQVPGLGGEAEARALMAKISNVKGVSLPEIIQGK